MNKGRATKRKYGTGQKTSQSERPEFDMKKARYEIIKFAMSGLSGTAKHDAETNLAISLGAKPPKSTYINYKELQITRKKEREERQLLRQSSTKPKVNKAEKNDGKKALTKKKPVKHSLETTGIYKVKAPPGSSRNNSKNVFEGRGRRRRH